MEHVTKSRLPVTFRSVSLPPDQLLVSIVRRTYVIAMAITALIALWLVSGQLGHSAPKQQATLAELNSESSASGEDKRMTRVRARVVHAESQTDTVPLRGRTENKRTVIVKAETGGTVVARAVERGQRVETGQVLCRISTEDRAAKLEEGRQALNQAQNRVRRKPQAREAGADLRDDDRDYEGTSGDRRSAGGTCDHRTRPHPGARAVCRTCRRNARRNRRLRPTGHSMRDHHRSRPDAARRSSGRA